MTHTSTHTLNAKATTVVFALSLFLLLVALFTSCNKQAINQSAPSSPVNPANLSPKAVIDPRAITTSQTRKAIFLNGGPSTNPLSTPLQYRWSLLKGDSTLVEFETPDRFQTYVKGFEKVGTYQILLTVTTQAGKSSSDTATIKVLPNKPPVAKAGKDIFLDYPDVETVLNGKDSYDEYDEIVRSEWRQISGPTNAVIPQKENVTSRVYNLAAGRFDFELTVYDGFNEAGKDTVIVEVAKPSIVINSNSAIISALPIQCPMGCWVAIPDYKQFLPQNATLKKVYIRSHNTTTWYQITDDPNATPSYYIELGYLVIWVNDEMELINPKVDVRLSW